MSMLNLNKPSLTLRIGVGKLAGFAIGLLGFFLLPLFQVDVALSMRIGFLLWYTTMGAVIGVFGVYAFHPILHLPLPWWFRAPLVGGWMNLVLALFIHQDLQVMVMTLTGAADSTFSPFYWLVFDGIIAGYIIGWIATRFGGEGAETVLN